MIRTGSFMFNNRVLTYFVDRYNNTEDNERSVEVPIVFNLYNKFQERNGKILEIGAVIPHYHPLWGEKLQSVIYPHICVDSHEEGKGIINRKIEYWKPDGKEKYDFIFSISTLEHIFDGNYNLSDAEKISSWIIVINKLKSFLAPKGLLLITIPGYQPSNVGGGGWMDQIILNVVEEDKRDLILKIEDDTWYPDKIFKMNRMGFGAAGNKWKEVDPHRSPTLSFYEEVPSAGSVFFLCWGNFDDAWKIA